MCPSYVDAPAAEDRVPVALGGLPRAGVIDPSLVVADGRPHLVYKTDRVPSSIWLLPLSRSGLHAAGRLGDAAVAGRLHPLLLRTVWRRSTSILIWSAATSGILLDRDTRLCGPGGADVTAMPHSRRLRVYFHAWTCHGAATPCGPGIRKDRRRHRARAIRPMYAADLAWLDGAPVVAGFLRSHRSPDVGLRRPPVLGVSRWCHLKGVWTACTRRADDRAAGPAR